MSYGYIRLPGSGGGCARPERGWNVTSKVGLEPRAMKPWCFALILLLWSGRAGQAQAAEAEGSRAKVYSTSGVVQQVSATEGRVTIHHKAIPDFMPEMTMDFKVRDTNDAGCAGGCGDRF